MVHRVHGRRHQRVAHDADAVRVRDGDRCGQHPGFADPFEAGQLAVAVEAVTAGEDRLAPIVGAARDDHGDAGPDRALADDQRSVARDERRVADANARDVRDGVEWPGPATPDDDAEVACTHPRMLAGGGWRRSPRGRAGRRSTGDARRFTAEVAVSSPGDPTAGPTPHDRAERRERHDPAATSAGPRRRRSPDRRRRGVPRPARPDAVRERPTRSQRPLDVPDRRPDRGPGVTGGRTRPVRGGPEPGRPAGCDTRRGRRHATVPRRSGRVPRL